MDYLEGEEITEERLKAAIRRATLDIDAHPGAVRLRLQEQGRADAAGRRGRLPAFADRRAAGEGHRSRATGQP